GSALFAGWSKRRGGGSILGLGHRWWRLGSCVNSATTTTGAKALPSLEHLTRRLSAALPPHYTSPWAKSLPQRLKPRCLRLFTARLKSCPSRSYPTKFC